MQFFLIISLQVFQKIHEKSLHYVQRECTSVTVVTLSFCSRKATLLALFSSVNCACKLLVIHIVVVQSVSMEARSSSSCIVFIRKQWRRQGGKRGRLPPPNVEKDGPHTSSKFGEKIGGGGYPFQM